MGRLASASDFEDNGVMYTNYRRYQFFAERAAVIHEAFPTGKILIAGCGWGFLVDELVKLGRDAFGFDASPYATARSVEVLGPTISSRVFSASVLVRAQMTSTKASIGFSGAQKVPLLVTEDLLPVLTNAEITTALTECRRIATNLLHVVTPGDPADPSKLAGLNWKPVATWKTTVAPDAVMNAEAGNRIV